MGLWVVSLEVGRRRQGKRRPRISFGTDQIREFHVDPEEEAFCRRRKDEKKCVVIYEERLYKKWKAMEDEEVVEKFTIPTIDEFVSKCPEYGFLQVRQVLFVVANKELLRSVTSAAVLRHANMVAFPEKNQRWGRHFKNLSPVRTEIKSVWQRTITTSNEKTGRSRPLSTARVTMRPTLPTRTRPTWKHSSTGLGNQVT